MATYFVVDNPAFLVRITDRSPNFGVNTADRVKPILAIGVAHMWIADSDGFWKCYEVPNVLLLPKCDQVLYSVRIMRDLFGFKHDFDAAISITMPGRPALQMRDNGTSFAITVAFSTIAVSASRRVRPVGHVAALSRLCASRRLRRARPYAACQLRRNAPVAAVPAPRLPLCPSVAPRRLLHPWPQPPAWCRHEWLAACARRRDAWPRARSPLLHQAAHRPQTRRRRPAQ